MYARINVPWGLNGKWSVGTGAVTGSNFDANGPTNGQPGDPYSICLWLGWYSTESKNPYNAGDVVRLDYKEGDVKPVENPTVIFTKP